MLSRNKNKGSLLTKNIKRKQDITSSEEIKDYTLIAEGICLNCSPLTTVFSDFIGVQTLIESLDTTSEVIYFHEVEKIEQSLINLLNNCDEQYIVSSSKGVLSAVINGNQLIEGGIHLNTLFYGIDNNCFCSVYYIGIKCNQSIRVMYLEFIYEQDKRYLRVSEVAFASLFELISKKLEKELVSDKDKVLKKTKNNS